MVIPAQKNNDTRKRLLAAFFSKASKIGLDLSEEGDLRSVIVPSLCKGKRLSEATAQEIVRVIEHVTKLYNIPSPFPLPCRERVKTSSPLTGEDGGEGENIVGSAIKKDGSLKKSSSLHPDYKRYESSRAGLIEELKDAARARWGADFEKPLNEFVSHNRPCRTHYRFLDVTALKAIKERIKELNAKEVSR